MEEYLHKMKFSHDYDKLPENWIGSEAILLSVQDVGSMESFKVRNPKFIEADTKIRDSDDHYPLNFEHGIILYFRHVKSGVLFTTIRRYTESKDSYYRSLIGESFTLDLISDAEKS